MGRCVIFGAAEFDSLLCPVSRGDYVIAADGGLVHTRGLGIQPDGVLGDFDSLGFVPQDARVFPVEKDDTDVMLAVRHGLKLGCREFFLYGALDGRRLDHTIANFQTLAFLTRHGARGWLVGRDYIVTAVKDGSVRFPATFSGILSVFCMGADAEGVTLEGLKYPLEKGRLTADFPLGVSNHFIGKEAVVTVEKGTLLLMWDRGNGMEKK